MNERPTFSSMVEMLEKHGYEWGVSAYNHRRNLHGQTYGYRGWVWDPKRVTKNGRMRPWHGSRADTPELALWDAYSRIDGSF